MDRIMHNFLSRQLDAGMALARESDLLELAPCGGSPPQRYVARFLCRGLVRTPGGEVQEWNDFLAGIWFMDSHLRRVDPFQVVTWLGPDNVFHPNISNRNSVVCAGHIYPGMGLVELLYQVHEIITYQKVTMREDDALNRDACVWARRNKDRFPIDTRPLRRRRLSLRVEMGQEVHST